MPFIPHTEQDISEMLNVIGIKKIDDLFDEIPSNLRIDGLKNIPEAMSEMDVSRFMRELANKDKAGLCFIGAGAYEHHIPAAIWEIAGRGEFMTAYTPYQAEASQGTLQTIYEYQTMISNLMGMDVSNASLYDGASAVGEASLMALRANRKSKSKKILVPKTLHPSYRRTAKAIAGPQDVEFVELDYDKKIGNTLFYELEKYNDEDIAAVIIQQPNFFGTLEEVDEITNWAHKKNTLVIAVVNPLAMSILKAPGKWGEKGADIAIGDGQPFGCPLSSGGPYFGFMCSKIEHVRSMPGRIIGKTTDSKGNEGYVLNLQAREQHIRRAKATSNICSNQGLMVVVAAMYMSLLGADGLQKIAISCNNNANKLRELLASINGVENIFSGNIFHEFVLKLNKPVSEVLEKLNDLGIQGGFNLKQDYPELGEALLVCATETKTDASLEQYKKALQKVEEL